MYGLQRISYYHKTHHIPKQDIFWLALSDCSTNLQTVLQLSLSNVVEPPALGGQLLKWIGSKHRVAGEIAGYFPRDFETYIEPFLGSGALMARVAPTRGLGGDRFGPLVEIWRVLAKDPDTLKRWYSRWWHRAQVLGKKDAYAECLDSYNRHPNGADFVFLCRACYGGVVRFRKADGFMSTPCGIHDPISPESFAARVDTWHLRLRNCEFFQTDYRELMQQAGPGDLVYCDPPYVHSQTILYGAQEFRLEELMRQIALAKERGARVVLSIDGSKKSGLSACPIETPHGLFERVISINCGRSMLRRFQLEGATAENEMVADRLLLTY
jgi:DNA adenine methylase